MECTTPANCLLVTMLRRNLLVITESEFARLYFIRYLYDKLYRTNGDAIRISRCISNNIGRVRAVSYQCLARCYNERSSLEKSPKGSVLFHCITAWVMIGGPLTRKLIYCACVNAMRLKRVSLRATASGRYNRYRVRGRTPHKVSLCI